MGSCNIERTTGLGAEPTPVVVPASGISSAASPRPCDPDPGRFPARERHELGVSMAKLGRRQRKAVHVCCFVVPHGSGQSGGGEPIENSDNSRLMSTKMSDIGIVQPIPPQAASRGNALLRRRPPRRRCAGFVTVICARAQSGLVASPGYVIGSFHGFDDTVPTTLEARNTCERSAMEGTTIATSCEI
ncbi:hypothetical protein LX32DRAFT_214013 [Colletotrichum zoysiae]|uniref:Uncharacterized protein n=1 Tax=Colletotrichum zoysiae TaxID=1216348 RepID=A0AAD9LU40_9PEZI|nr:hypothetical protein LX32DRAFT_214013 [Colletotrichum zoysiae]